MRIQPGQDIVPKFQLGPLQKVRKSNKSAAPLPTSPKQPTSLVDEDQIALVQRHSQASREQAIQALQQHDDNIVDAILSLLA